MANFTNPATSQTAGLCCLGAVAVYVTGSILRLKPLTLGGLQIVYPRPGIVARQFVASPLELIGACGIIYFALPAEGNPGFFVVLAVFLGSFSAALASNAPSGPLYCKDETGAIMPWPHTQDVTFRSWRQQVNHTGQDSPLARLAELFNVNHYVVSQTRPYIVPFLYPDTHPGQRIRTPTSLKPQQPLMRLVMLDLVNMRRHLRHLQRNRRRPWSPQSQLTTSRCRSRTSYLSELIRSEEFLASTHVLSF